MQNRRRTLQIIGVTILALALILPMAAGALAAPTAPDPALPPAESIVGGTGTTGRNQADTYTFNPDLIISDQVFYNSLTMDAAAIDTFIAGRGALCLPGIDGTPCLKDWRETTVDREPDRYCLAGYRGAENETAGQIIAKVAQSCAVNPQALLVMLQKEQGLVSASGPALTPQRYKTAMGYGCPDSAACDEKYFGFFNQVYSAARQFQIYKTFPKAYKYVAGQVNEIAFHPQKSCGFASVFVQNQATASLYNYTPYVPNAAALAAGAGLGDECSSYGNRNFVRFFTAWFGSPTDGVKPVPVVAQALRLAGDSRITTAVEISKRAFAGGAQVAYLARADVLVDALAAGSLRDGPVLLVPPTGPVPEAVRAEISRLRAREVYALGGAAAISPDTLYSLSSGVSVGRVFGDTRVATAVAISQRAFPAGAQVAYLAQALGPDGTGSPDAVAGGSLTGGPILLTDGSPAGVAALRAEVARLGVARVTALGGQSAVSDADLQMVAAALPVGRLAGADRYGTALAIAQEAVATGTPGTAWYLARGDVFADAVAAGVLTDGPVVLVPSCGGLLAGLGAQIKASKAVVVAALGGTTAVCAATLEAALAAAK